MREKMNDFQQGTVLVKSLSDIPKPSRAQTPNPVHSSLNSLLYLIKP